MWQVDNRTPFAAERGWVRDRNGAEVWLVAVKCTFDIEPDGSTEVSEEQPPVLRAAGVLTASPARAASKYEADLVLTKTTTDIIVVGHAYAPGGTAVTRTRRRLSRRPGAERCCGSSAIGVWSSAASSRPEPFTKMPLVYERAFGGVDRASQQTRSATGSGAIRSAPASPSRGNTLTGAAAAQHRVSRRARSGPGTIARAGGLRRRLAATGSRGRASPAPTTTSG